MIKKEEVVHTYCDVCGKEITGQTQVGPGSGSRRTDRRGHDYVVCQSTKYDMDLSGRKGVRFDCEMVAKFYLDHPPMANKMWLDAIEAAKKDWPDNFPTYG